MKKSSISRTRRFTYFQNLCYALERWARTHNQILSGRTSWQVDVTIQSFGHNWWWANGIRVEYAPRIHHIAARRQSPIVPASECKGRIIFMSLLNDISRGSKDNKQEFELSAQLVLIYAKRSKIFPAGRWSFLWPGLEKKWYSTQIESKPQGEWDRVAELMMINTQWESGHPVFRATSPLSRGTLKAKEVENYQYTSALMGIRLKLFFAQLFLLISSVSTEQSQICVPR